MRLASGVGDIHHRAVAGRLRRLPTVLVYIDSLRKQVPAPGGWTKTFTDPRLCAAIVNRLTFNSEIIETGTDSYRPVGGCLPKP